MSVALKLAAMLPGTAAYVGLAVLGRGGLAAFFSDPALAALSAYRAHTARLIPGVY